ncbi:MAG: hypothetical protein AABW85_04065 [archaeon]
MKGQVALEYLLITGFLLLAAGLIFIYSIITLDQNLNISKADTALSKIAGAVETVSANGPGNKIFVDAQLPNEISSNLITISNKTISMTIPMLGGPNERYITTKAQLTPTTITTNGSFISIKIESVDENVELSRV